MDGFNTEIRQYFNCPCTPDPNPYLTNLISAYENNQMVSVAQFRALIDELLEERKLKEKRSTIKQNKQYWPMIFDSLKKEKDK